MAPCTRSLFDYLNMSTHDIITQSLEFSFTPSEKNAGKMALAKMPRMAISRHSMEPQLMNYRSFLSSESSTSSTMRNVLLSSLWGAANDVKLSSQTSKNIALAVQGHNFSTSYYIVASFAWKI